MNSVQILGNITRDIELKYTQSGTAIGSFGIAYNEKRKDTNGNYNDVVHFFDCTAFGKTAENINNYFHKGSRILIQGSLDYSSWTDQQGQKKSKAGIKVQQFDFIDKKSDNAGQGQQNYNQQSNNSQTNQTQQQNYNQQPQQQGYGQQQARQYKQPEPNYIDKNGNPMPTPSSNTHAYSVPEIDIDEDEIPF